jgi:uncharacterized membrane protein
VNTNGLPGRSATFGQLIDLSAGARVAWSAAAGLTAGLVGAVFILPQAAALIGWDVAAAVFLVLVWSVIWGLGPESTQHRATHLDPSTGLAELLVTAAGVAILTAVALALVRAGGAHGALKALLLIVGLGSVILSWLTVHTVFTLRYARLFYRGEPGGIDFNDGETPNYLDFAYLAFTIGMTFQVSDTNLTARALRRAALQHSLISYLLGAVILAMVINIVSSLL